MQQRFPDQCPPPGPRSPGVQTPQQQRNIYGHYPGQQSPYSPSQQQPQMAQSPYQGGFRYPHKIHHVFTNSYRIIPQFQPRVRTPNAILIQAGNTTIASTRSTPPCNPPINYASQRISVNPVER